MVGFVPFYSWKLIVYNNITHVHLSQKKKLIEELGERENGC